MDVRRVPVYSGQRRPNKEGGVPGTDGKDIRGCFMLIFLVDFTNDTGTVLPKLYFSVTTENGIDPTNQAHPHLRRSV